MIEISNLKYKYTGAKQYVFNPNRSLEIFTNKL